MPKICYFCTDQSTSREHVPPQCLFPELKDVPSGTNYRKNLVTVPACDAHNSAKSEDDTYLMMVLVSYFKNNRAAQDQINSKVIRAWTNDRKLANTVVNNFRTVQISGEVQHAYEIDMERFDRSLEYVAHGLHFHSFKSRPTNPYRAISYPLVQLEGEGASEANLGRAKILSLADQMLAGLQFKGSNPEIFWYQISPEVNGTHVIRMCFYEAFVVVALSSPTTGSNNFFGFIQTVRR